MKDEAKQRISEHIYNLRIFHYLRRSQEEKKEVVANEEAAISIDRLSAITTLVKQHLKKTPNNEKILEKKIKVFCHLGNLQSAFALVSDWVKQNPEHPVAKREFKRLETVMAVLQDENSDDDDKPALGATSCQKPSSTPPQTPPEVEAVKPVPKNTVRVLPPQPPRNTTKHNNEESLLYFCSFCDVRFARQEELDTHCHSDQHKNHLASDESHGWTYRPPPRGQTSEEYALCQRYQTSRCPFGDKCTQAHSEAELEEWQERLAFRKQQLQKARDNQLHGNTFTERLLEKLTNPEGPKVGLVQSLEFVKIHVNSDLKVNMTTKKCTNAWTFTVTSKVCLHGVALLDDVNRSYFHISSISVGPKKTQKYQNLETHCQEWINQDAVSKSQDNINKSQGEYVYRVKIVFKTDIYGTFRQSVIFDFGLDAIVVRETQVESAPVTDPEKLSKDLVLSTANRWTHDDVTVVPFTPKLVSYLDKEEQLLSKYILPHADRLSLLETLTQPLSKDNYRLWMHEMLYLEELAELAFIQRFNVSASLQLVNRFLLMPGALSSAKYTREGELFARLKLEDVLSEDSMAGRLILQNAQIAWVAPAVDTSDGNKEMRKVYEAMIEDKGKNFVFLRLSSTCVSDLKLTCDEDFVAQIQFQLNRLPKCEMHAAVDGLSTLDIVFPDTTKIVNVSAPDEKVITSLEDMPLNAQQKEAILNITALGSGNRPPLLIIGPFGTGKTYTLAQAAKLVLQQEGTRVLICTHSNSAADLYIKDFFHPFVEAGQTELRPLRIYYHLRWMQTVPEVILQYSLFQREGPAAGTFGMPTTEDIMKHRVIITTLSTARYINDLSLSRGFFTHIFIDEAAQALECETLIPLSLANEDTCIVLAGDHMQISPEVYSPFTQQQGFHLSFLERLYDMYPTQCPWKVMLCENYRSHAAIVDFTSELFYDHQLIASGKQIPHPTLYPLSFFAAMGEEVQHENNTGFYNLSEMYEVVDRVDDLVKKWPEEWGELNGNSISVVSPYMDQVIRIRGELRKRKIYNVSVERVLNVQEAFIFVFLLRKVWEYFLEVCQQNNSLFGITWNQLRSQLDRAEVAKNYVLNPLAPEFVPNRLFHITRQSAEAAAAAAYLPQAPLWHYMGPQHLQYSHGAPYQMYPQMMPYFSMPMYTPYVGPVLMRPPAGGGLWGHHKGGVPRANVPHLAAQRAESIRMVDFRPSYKPSRGRMTAYPFSRLPLSYPLPTMYPIYPNNHPSHQGYYLLPDDLRLAALQQQYSFPYNHQPIIRPPLGGPHTHLHGPVYHGIPLHSPFGSGQHGLASPSDRGDEGVEARGSPDTRLNTGNSSSPIPAFQVLPNVKHVPPHLRPGLNPPSQNSSRSSTPVNQVPMPSIPGLAPGPLPEGRGTPVSERPYSPANYGVGRSSTPLSAEEASQDVKDRGLPNFAKSAATSNLVSDIMTGTGNRPVKALSEEGAAETYAEVSANQNNYTAATPASASLKNKRDTKQLRLQTTGFSRQFSDDLPTPTAITDIVRMIEENIEEGTESSENTPSPSAVPQRIHFVSLHNGRNAALSSLQLDLTAAQQLQHQQHNQPGSANSQPSSSDSSSPASKNEERPTYAGVVQKMPPSPGTLVPDISQMEPQTPRTPSGFMTPGGDMDLDPFGILKSLNIEATNAEQRRIHGGNSLQ
ncbi:hypothetical protein C0Q70_01946 [Pomacea canaliculata]|uniref:C3H1-type domain-containing protein n=1 Tax=Pomacea canaliculata TaxID=400727 RepID=A0A2T7Q0Z8_POMCA|nr:hypothetical protein C0Q70_01946 [Pomacea canaliculata]